MTVFSSKANSGLTDEELISKYRFSHDNSYLGELFLRYLPYVFGVALGVLKNQKDAEDLTMTVFYKIASDLKRIEVKDFSLWLYQLTKNLCIVESKKKRADTNDSKNILLDELASKDDNNLFINAVASKEVKINANNLRLGINTLNESQKVCIDLFYMQNKSYLEVAEATGFTLNQVKTNIQNGKRLLKTYLENRGL